MSKISKTAKRFFLNLFYKQTEPDLRAGKPRKKSPTRAEQNGTPGLEKRGPENFPYGLGILVFTELMTFSLFVKLLLEILYSEV